MDDKNNKSVAVNNGHSVSGTLNSVRNTLSIFAHMRISQVVEVLRFPVLLGLLGLDLCTVAPFFVFTIGMYGTYSVLGLIVTQSPIIYLTVQEIRRRDTMLPMSEAWETSREKWLKALEEYTKLVKKKSTTKR